MGFTRFRYVLRTSCCTSPYLHTTYYSDTSSMNASYSRVQLRKMLKYTCVSLALVCAKVRARRKEIGSGRRCFLSSYYNQALPVC